MGSLCSHPASFPAAELRIADLAENPTVVLSLELALVSQFPPGDLASSSLRSHSALSMNLGICGLKIFYINNSIWNIPFKDLAV